MRSHKWVRWALCAVAMSLCVPAVIAQPRNKSIAACTSFDQTDKDDTTIELKIHNTCTVPVDCSVTWRVVCAPQSKKRRSVHVGSRKWALESSASQSVEASAAVCGDDSWSIEGVNWSCEPNKE